MKWLCAFHISLILATLLQQRELQSFPSTVSTFNYFCFFVCFCCTYLTVIFYFWKIILFALKSSIYYRELLLLIVAMFSLSHMVTAVVSSFQPAADSS